MKNGRQQQNIRSSNTEPYLRLIIEVSNEELLKERMETHKGIIKTFK
ncbi:MAG: hypothetical protein U9N51_09480 [Bacteroidota bacterium]|nr:hypothetical protein [Bacteroidota bacterium]